MKKVQKKEKPTLESLWAYLYESKKESKKESAESKREMREFREYQEKANRELRESIKETDRQLKESMEKSSRELNESMERSSREMKESMERTSRELKESMEETDRQMKITDEKICEVSRQLGTIGNSNGDMAEEYFQSAFTKDPRLNGEIYDEIDFNLKLGLKKGQVGNEYDIVMANGKSVAIIEIKYHFEIEKKKIKEVLSKILNKVETFKEFYPEYKNYKFYLGIASLSFRKNIEKILHEEGVAVIKQVGDKMVINSENLKIF